MDSVPELDDADKSDFVIWVLLELLNRYVVSSKPGILEMITHLIGLLVAFRFIAHIPMVIYFKRLIKLVVVSYAAWVYSIIFK